jgi:hypothetical protein
MTLLAKSIVKNKCWIVEKDGAKIGTIMSNPYGVVYRYEKQREQFASLKLLSDRYNIRVEKSQQPRAPKRAKCEIYGFPTQGQPHNVLWNVRLKLPIYTKSRKSKSYFCAGHYIVKINNEWTSCFCPKLITMNRYAHVGPYDSQAECDERLSIANGALHGTSIKSASQEV